MFSTIDKTRLNQLIFGDIFFLILATVKQFKEEHYMDIAMQLGSPIEDPTLGVLSLIYIIGMLISLYLIYKLKKLGRILFVAMLILGIYIMRELIVHVLSGGLLYLTYISALFEGAIFITIFYSDLKHKFK